MNDKIKYFLDAWEMNGVGKTVARVQDGPGTVVTLTVDDLRSLAASASAEPVGEFVGYQKVGFQQVSIIAWNRHVPMGTKLYDSPSPIEAPDKSQPVIADKAKLVADLFNAREVIAAMILENEDEGLTESTIKKARDIVYSPFSMPGAAKPVGYASQSELNHNDEEHPSHLYPTPTDEYAVPLYATPSIDAAPDNSQVALSAEQEGEAFDKYWLTRGSLDFGERDEAAAAWQARAALSAPASMSAEPKLPKGLIRDLLTASDLLSKEWRARNAEVGKRLYEYAEDLSNRKEPKREMTANERWAHHPHIPSSVYSNPTPSAENRDTPRRSLEVMQAVSNLNSMHVSVSADNRPAQDDVRDAQRYRWLRSSQFDAAMPVMFDYDGPAPYCGIRRTTNHLDEAIDAAIASQSAKEPK